ncbi:carbohydrate ABC transporter permease [Acuticoccus sp. MNP-M23]|uniref:carbohydrate ABC transporter permease n=1 Tax=Acuticoccus sp. MNP-M23 TaxID=3072793 RepID=UPI002814E645|nr:carbohydrate ABC transporter permease [Acuticoccus sp. MNP-M23]WMS44958.1 carbohydrate ABC transporter permease [Acuticoccus sp. MNP-M23]
MTPAQAARARMEAPRFPGWLTAGVLGLLWGATLHLLGGVTLTLITGTAMTPQLGGAAVAGLVAGLALAWRPLEERTFGFRAIVMALVAALIVAAAFGAPYGQPLDHASLWQMAGLLLTAVALVNILSANLRTVTLARQTRRATEHALASSLGIFGHLFFAVIVILPFYVLVMTSFKTQQSLIANPLDLSIDFSQGFDSLFDSYIQLFTTYDFGRYMLISFVVSTLTVVICLAFAVPGAYAVARLNFPGRQALSRSILLIYLVPAIVLVIPLYAVFSQLGLRNTVVGLLIVYPATTLPVAIYMLSGYFRGVPAELEEAGLMDGLSRVGVIRKITLPLSLPALASVGLYVFMIAWNEFLFAFMFLDDPKIFTLSRAVVSLNSSEVPRQYLMAGAVVTTIPILFLFLLAERFMVKGLTAGGVKG